MKKIGFLTLLITATLLLTMGLTASAAGPATPAAMPAAAPAAPAAAAPTPMPPHPHVREALEAMHRAKDEMQAAEAEFHGHRKRAIEHLDAAIHEAEICMQEP